MRVSARDRDSLDKCGLWDFFLRECYKKSGVKHLIYFPFKHSLKIPLLITPQLRVVLSFYKSRVQSCLLHICRERILQRKAIFPSCFISTFSGTKVNPSNNTSSKYNYLANHLDSCTWAMLNRICFTTTNRRCKHTLRMKTGQWFWHFVKCFKASSLIKHNKWK